MTQEPLYRVRLAKEDFKFSAAHFTVFPDGSGETLHGHNYQVALEVEGPRLDELGLLCDFDRVKKAVRERCAAWDSRTLIPAQCPSVRVTTEDGSVAVAFGERRYRFPEADTLLLPMVNTTIELLALELWRLLRPTVAADGVTMLAVEVAETAGQSCIYRAPLG